MAALNHVIRQLRRLVGVDGVKDDSDGQLLEQFCRTRDERAFATLVERHGAMVLGVCRRVLGNAADADDAFQATFLTLARKAAAIRKQGSVASWLYGVAQRVALKARTRAGRRRTHERQASAMSSAPSSPVLWSDLGDVIDEELRQLPERFRAPVVLCYLEGKTREQAADELGCSCDTVKGRLERARDTLRARLARRGLALSAAGLATLLAENARAAVSLSLSASTVSLVIAGAAPGPVTNLVEGVVRDMFLSKLKTALAAGVAFVTLVTACFVAHAALSTPKGDRADSQWFVPVPAERDDRPIDLSIDTAVVHKYEGDLPDQEGLAAVLGDPAAELKDLSAQFRVSAAQGRARLSKQEKISLFTTGPLLDSPDKVTVRRLVRTGKELDLQIDYSNVRKDGAVLLQNLTWTPLVQVPVELPAGKYCLKVTWTKVPGTLGDRFQQVAPKQPTYDFEVVVPGKSELPSKRAQLHRILAGSPEAKLLSAGVTVLVNAPADTAALAKQYALEEKGEAPKAFDAGSRVTLVTVGPELNSPDKVRVQRLTLKEQRLVLDIHYVQDVQNLDRNVPWLPLVALPVDLPAGKYELIVNWQRYSDITKAIVPVAPVSQTTSFVLEGK